MILRMDDKHLRCEFYGCNIKLPAPTGGLSVLLSNEDSGRSGSRGSSSFAER